MRRGGRAGRGFVGALLLACCAGDAHAQPPVEIYGELEASVTSRHLTSDDKHEIISQVLAHAHVSTYLGQPWIATVSADLNAAFDTSSETGFGEATSIGGDVVIAVLPMSRFPFQLFFSASDSHFDGEYSLDYTRMRAGVSGRAAFSDRGSLDYLVSHDEFDRFKFGSLTAQRAEATLRNSFSVGELPLNVTDASMSFIYYNTNFRAALAGDPDNSTESVAGNVFLRAAPTERTLHDFSATVISDRSIYNRDRYDRLIGQAVGTGQWRSPTNDVVTTGAVRMMLQQIDHRFGQEKTDTDAAVMAASAGVSWRPLDRLSMSLGARASFERIQTIADEDAIVQPEVGRSNVASGVLGSIDYRSLPYDMGGFNWHWDARATGDLGYTTNRYKTNLYERIYGPRSDATVSIGHAFERLMRVPWLETVNFTFLQEAGLAHYSYYEEFNPFVTHSSSLTKGFSDEMGSSYFRLYFRDTHGFGDRFEEYQTAQLDFSRHVQLNGNQSLHGSVGVQVVRQVRDGRDDVYVFSPADLEYEYRDFFGYYGLSFVSTLRINGIGLNDPAHDWSDQLSPNLFRNDWRNRLQYRIGELWLSLEGTVFQVDGDFGHFVRFAGRRNFDFVD